MKSLLLSLLLVLTINGIAQSKKDNAITFPVDGITEDKIMNALISSGYGIDKQGNGYWLTDETGKKGGPAVKLSVYKKDSVYLMQGRMNSNGEFLGVKDGWEIISNKGMKGSIYQRAWGEMLAVANKISTNLKFTKVN